MIFDEPSRQALPNEPEFADHRAAVIKGMLASIPVLGNVLAEELGLLLSLPLTQRRDAWFEDLARRLRDIETKGAGFRFDDLSQNEQFVSSTIQATQAAMRTHQTEKLEALRNAVLNVATGNAPSDDLQLIFLNLVDSFTPIHLQILSHFAGKDRSGADRFRRERDLTDHVVCDLRDRSLLRDTRPYAARGREDAEALICYDWGVTNLGRQFLQFIAEPGFRKASK